MTNSTMIQMYRCHETLAFLTPCAFSVLARTAVSVVSTPRSRRSSVFCCHRNTKKRGRSDGQIRLCSRWSLWNMRCPSYNLSVRLVFDCERLVFQPADALLDVLKDQVLL